MDPNPDYDASDEVEYSATQLVARGSCAACYPPPAYPPV